MSGAISGWAPLGRALGAGVVAAALALGCGSSSDRASLEAPGSTSSEPEPAAPDGASPAGVSPDAVTPQTGSPGDELPAAGSGAPVSEEGPAGASGALVPGEYAGVYSVPVSDELEPYAAFAVESVRLDGSASELRLSYDLPELLLGEHRRLSFRGKLEGDGRYVLEGDDGVATCTSTSAGLRCEEVLRDVRADDDALERLLAGLPDAEASARRAVSAEFSIDPIGVLDVSIER